MLLNETQLLEKCKMMNITAIEASKIHKNINVELEYDLEEFLYLCKNCKTSVIFYDYQYYDKRFLHIDECTEDRELRGCWRNSQKELKELKERLSRNFSLWNAHLDTQDFSQPNSLTLIASIDGVVTTVSCTDNWLQATLGNIVLPATTCNDNRASVASCISHMTSVDFVYR